MSDGDDWRIVGVRPQRGRKPTDEERRQIDARHEADRQEPRTLTVPVIAVRAYADDGDVIVEGDTAEGSVVRLRMSVLEFTNLQESPLQ